MSSSIRLPRISVPAPVQSVVTGKTKVNDPKDGYVTHSKRLGPAGAADDQKLLVTRKLFSRTYGKVRAGVMPNGTFVAVKEFRLNDPVKRSQTRKTKFLDGQKELALQVAAGGAKVLGQWRVGDKLYVATDLKAGGDLFELMAGLPPAGNATRKSVVRVAMRDTTAHLARMHAAGLVHGDVKSENMLVSKAGVELSDFGTAHPIGQQQDFLGGTDWPPELLRAGADQHTTQSDVWSLGMAFCIEASGLEPPMKRDAKLVAFENWYRAIGGDPNLVGTFASRSLNVEMDDFFRAVQRTDPLMFAYVFQNMLHPDPARRDSAHDAASCFAQMTRSDDQAVATGVFVWAEQQSRFAGVFKHQQALQQPVQSAPPAQSTPSPLSSGPATASTSPNGTPPASGWRDDPPSFESVVGRDGLPRYGALYACASSTS